MASEWREGWEACRAQMVEAVKRHADMVGEKGRGTNEGAASMVAVLWLASLMTEATPVPPEPARAPSPSDAGLRERVEALADEMDECSDSSLDLSTEEWADRLRALASGSTGALTDRCPTCGSPDPKRHPALQFEGEVQPCSDPWHGAAPPEGEKETT